MKRKQILRAVNLPRYILNHTIGEDHPIWHRLILGFVFMMIGHYMGEIHTFIIGCAGGFVHAFGAVPWLDWIISFEK